MRFIFAVLLLVACEKSHNSHVTPDEDTALRELQAKLMVDYAEAAETHVGHWPSDKDCDGALWAGIARAAGIGEVDMSLSLDGGRPMRRPGKDCGPATGDSAGTTSTDMMLGTIIGLYAAADLADLEAMNAYADAHHGIMGYPVDNLSLSFIKPGTRALLSRAIHNLGGPHAAWEDLAQVYTPPQHDYQLHLELLSMYQSKHSGAKLNFEEQQALLYEANHNPNDALAQAVSGNKHAAATLLLDSSWQVPCYVRGPETAATVHKLFVIKVIENVSKINTLNAGTL